MQGLGHSRQLVLLSMHLDTCKYKLERLDASDAGVTMYEPQYISILWMNLSGVVHPHQLTTLQRRWHASREARGSLFRILLPLH